MTSYHSLLGQIAGIFAFISFLPYIDSILRGKTKPQRTTFATWSIVSLITVISYIASGAHETIWIPLVYAIFQLLIFFLSLKYGVGGKNKLDIACFMGAGVGVALWIATRNPLFTLYIGIFIEILGFLPTLKKAYQFPKTENALSWSIATVGAILNFFAITSFTPAVVFLPLYIFLEDTSIAVLTLFPKWRFKNSNS